MTDLSAFSLVVPLIKGTEAGSAQWEEDPSGGYMSKIGDNTVNIYQDDMAFILRVIDKRGDVVDWAEGDLVDEKNQLQRLFFLARRRAKNIDVVVADILRHLEDAPGTRP